MQKPQQTMSPRAWGELTFLSLIWGGIFLSVRVSLEEIGPLTLVAHRVVWAALLLWGIVLFRGLSIPRSGAVWIGFGLMGLMNNVVPFTLQAWAQLHIESGLTSILNAGTAIWGVLIAAVFLSDEQLTWRKTCGVVLGFVGVATAIGLQNLTNFDLRSLGQWAVIASTISYGLAGVWARKRLSGLSPVVAAAGMLTCSSLIMVPLATFVEGPMTLALTSKTLISLGYTSVVATACAYMLYYRVLALAGSGNLMLCTLLIAPIAIILGALFLGEALPLRAYVGFGVIAIGLLILNGTLRFPFRTILR